MGYADRTFRFVQVEDNNNNKIGPLFGFYSS